MKKIVLVGNPNSGKSTLFNALTGSNQHIGNWPGVTVEKKDGKLKTNKEVLVVDLPGIYSLSPYSLEEIISRNYILNENVDLIVNIVDGSNLERNLYLTSQLLEMGKKMIIVVNKTDVVSSLQDKIDYDQLNRLFNTSVYPIVAMKENGISDLIKGIMDSLSSPYSYRNVIWYSKKVEERLSLISKLIESKVSKEQLRWYTVKLFELDEETLKNKLFTPLINELKVIVSPLEQELDNDSESIITEGKYHYIGIVMDKVYLRNKIYKEKISHKIDRIVMNKWAALPIFVAIIFLVYYLAISTIGGILTDYVNDVIFGDSGLPGLISSFLEWVHSPGWLSGLIINGMVAGVGAVLGFLPQMFVLFILLGILEESGYMARIAFILDRIFRKFGLSGKSFIPMLISTGCGIPGIMSSRTIEDENNRRMTIMTTTFMPCGAKLPVIALIAGALFTNSPYQWLIAPSAYFVGIGSIILSGIILKKLKAFAGDPAPFIMELPDYQAPRFKSLMFQVWQRLKSFITKAGTIILASAVVVWLLSSFNIHFEMIEDVNQSIMAVIGRFVDVIFKPIGWMDWKATVATFTGLIAKENVVSTFGVLYGFAEVGEDGSEIWSLLAQDFTALSAYSFLVFNLICAPCFAAIGAIRREMGNAKWTLIAVGYQTLFAYVLSFIIFQVGSLLQGSVTISSVLGVFVLLILLYMIFRKNKYKSKAL